MKRILLPVLFAIICVSSCQKSETGTAGVSIDSNGNLVISAPLYIRDIHQENPEPIPADKSITDTVEVYVITNASRHKLAEGTISEGRFSITIPKPDDMHLETAEDFISPEWVESGNNVRIATIEFFSSKGSLLLMDKPPIEQEISDDDFMEIVYGNSANAAILKGSYLFIYSEGDVKVYGDDSYISLDERGFHMRAIIDNFMLTKGWNTICSSVKDVNEESLINVFSCNTNKTVSPDAMWILEYNRAMDLANSGFKNLNIGEYDTAIEQFTEALQIDPFFAEAYHYRGVAYAQKEDLDTAIENYDKAISLSFDYALAYYNRGIAYTEKLEWDKAIEDFDKSIMLDPNNDQALNYRGYIYYYMDNFEKAIADFENVLRINPNDAYAKSVLDEIYIITHHPN